MLRTMIAGAVMFTAQAAHASEVPLYRPAPEWVKPAPAIDASKIDGESPIYLVLDTQNRLADGIVWTYNETATRLASTDIVAQAGTVSLSWQPDSGDLIVHAIEIIRGGERIDALAGGKKFTVIRREQQLEQLMLDGTLTATLSVEGLRVGDVLRLVSSTTNAEPALKGAVQAGAFLPVAPFRTGFARARLLWPATADVRWKSYAEGAKPSVTTAGGFRELVLTGPLPKPADLPNDAPLRFRSMPLVEASSFADWQSVSMVTAPLYATAGLIAPGSDLAREVATIAATHSDPLKRTAAALQLVQDKVRYLYNGMENGNYVPQSPDRTWVSRYGDCKAKTLLLLAVLHGLKIEAQPVLASLSGGDLVPTRLPSAAAFDHVLVHATIDGQSYWLDGTGSAARFADLRDTPPLRWVLPVQAGGATLLAVPMRAPATPGTTVTVDFDQRAGLKLPTLVHMTMRVRGPAAAAMGLAKTQGSKEDKEQLAGRAIGSVVGAEVSVVGYTINHVEADAEAMLEVDGIMTTPWKQQDKRFRMDLDRTISQLSFEPDRNRAAWRTIPVETPFANNVSFTSRVKLPPDLAGFSFEGDTVLGKPLAGMTVQRNVALTGSTITLTDLATTTGVEVSAADVPATRAAVALAKTRLLRVVSPLDVPSRAASIQAARRDGRLKPLVEAFGKVIAATPDDAEGYLNRASFFVGTFDWRSAVPDFDRAIALDPTSTTLLRRAYAHRMLGNEAKAVADYEAARTIDPAALEAIGSLGEIDADHGRRGPALERVDARIAAGGEDRWDFMMLKANLLGRLGDRDAAITLADQVVAGNPGNAAVLNGRCWLKATLGVALDSALKDCTRSIELSEWSGAVLDSRALVYYRMNRPAEALADLDAALDAAPDQAASLFLRGVIRGRQGLPGAKDDLATARTISPTIDTTYKRYGVVP